MTFLVSETIHYVIEADDGKSAIAARKAGEGQAQDENSSYRASEWKHPDPVPRDQWPMWAKALAQFSKPDDKGIGDVAARVIGAENSLAFKTWFKATFNRDCGCNGRQKLWNQKYPLNLKAT